MALLAVIVLAVELDVDDEPAALEVGNGGTTAPVDEEDEGGGDGECSWMEVSLEPE